MACVFKIPDESKGVISFTSNEVRLLVKEKTLEHLVAEKHRWIYLIHHNWQPCSHNLFFDASLCNPKDLIGGGACLDMDCCNFSPEVYRPGDGAKDIDVLYITRAVGFKRLQVFFNTCKELLRIKPDIKIMLVCSVPAEGASPANPREEYLKQFSREERRNFVGLFFDYDYPFTLDKHYLAHFYKSSKVFIHTANEERHPRLCSYAWASGIPVVGHPNLVSFLPNKFNGEPYFYRVQNDKYYAEQTIKALNQLESAAMPYEEIKHHVSENYSLDTLVKRIGDLPRAAGDEFDTKSFYHKNLDFRMGRHCEISLGDNSIDISIPKLMESAVLYGGEIAKDEPDFELSIIDFINGK